MKRIKINNKQFKKALIKDISKENNKKISPSKFREFILTCQVSELPNKNFALDVYKKAILE